MRSSGRTARAGRDARATSARGTSGPAAKRADLAGVTPHDLRHTCVALLVQLGAHPKAIQEWLGHSSITMTLDQYGHLFPSIEEALAGRLDELMFAGDSTT